ncbi:MAG: hypothetical protein TECD_00916 [Hyphomicrobiaceae bacterium hypho_1]
MNANDIRIPKDQRIYLLAEHLDSILALGEDLKSLCYYKNYNQLSCGSTSNLICLKTFIAEARKLEFHLIGHIKLAQNYANVLSKINNHVTKFTRLFSSCTAVIVDAIDQIWDREQNSFLKDSDPLLYLRSRNVIPSNTGCLKSFDRISMNDSFLVAERVNLGVLLDLCARFLDLLDENFDLFKDAAAVSSLMKPKSKQELTDETYLFSEDNIPYALRGDV